MPSIADLVLRSLDLCSEAYFPLDVDFDGDFDGVMEVL